MTEAYISMTTIYDDQDCLGFLQISRDDYDLTRWTFGKPSASTDWGFKKRMNWYESQCY